MKKFFFLITTAILGVLLTCGAACGVLDDGFLSASSTQWTQESASDSFATDESEESASAEDENSSGTKSSAVELPPVPIP